MPAETNGILPPTLRVTQTEILQLDLTDEQLARDLRDLGYHVDVPIIMGKPYPELGTITQERTTQVPGFEVDRVIAEQLAGMGIKYVCDHEISVLSLTNGGQFGSAEKRVNWLTSLGPIISSNDPRLLDEIERDFALNRDAEQAIFRQVGADSERRSYFMAAAVLSSYDTPHSNRFLLYIPNANVVIDSFGKPLTLRHERPIQHVRVLN